MTSLGDEASLRSTFPTSSAVLTTKVGSAEMLVSSVASSYDESFGVFVPPSSPTSFGYCTNSERRSKPRALYARETITYQFLFDSGRDNLTLLDTLAESPDLVRQNVEKGIHF